MHHVSYVTVMSTSTVFKIKKAVITIRLHVSVIGVGKSFIGREGVFTISQAGKHKDDALDGIGGDVMWLGGPVDVSEGVSRQNC